MSLTVLSPGMVFGFHDQILWYVILMICAAYINWRPNSQYVGPLVAPGALGYIAMSCIALSLAPTSTIDFADQFLRWTTTDSAQGLILRYVHTCKGTNDCSLAGVDISQDKTNLGILMYGRF